MAHGGGTGEGRGGRGGHNLKKEPSTTTRPLARGVRVLAGWRLPSGCCLGGSLDIRTALVGY